jgi:acyl carrier protein
MSADATTVGGVDLGETVRRLVAEVLMVPEEKVGPRTALVAELGAESIDFLDLVFRLEEALGRKIPVARWVSFVRERLADQDLAVAITPEVIREFAEREAGAPRAGEEPPNSFWNG